ncbi:hypothetical protein PPERSA_07517 [Pseudocohnilembus persalinus]|uniref:Uncharacterized protein n=1 Tax=Pseudocohnilembus persalinus TaxID=266149 RepID=A0A0V0QZP3_PSEPJ|nr:hypothetical protein PPERSA_07517 [Pseudocohnilembus persalinus]|eukprot:KRX07767.1 hypothetical protein PPERSA_07517 [Pseudocohnilembus persalinus]
MQMQEQQQKQQNAKQQTEFNEKKLQQVNSDENNSQQQDIYKNEQKQLYIGFFCAKKLKDDNYSQVDIIGDNILKFDRQKTVFKGLKFGETTFMSRSDYFVMALILFYFSDSENDQSKTIIVTIYTSPKVYVDARKKQWSERQAHPIEIFEPFNPQALYKNYERPNIKPQQPIKIGDDLFGLYNYFTSASIRNKIRNPFFLLLRFPNAVRLYYNQDLFKVEPEHIFLQIQELIYQAQTETKRKEENQKMENRPIILQLQDLNFDDKIREKDPQEISCEISKYLIFLDGPSCYYQQNRRFSNLPSNFKELVFTESLIEVYKQNYQQLVNLHEELEFHKYSNCQLSKSQMQNSKYTLNEEQFNQEFHRQDNDVIGSFENKNLNKKIKINFSYANDEKSSLFNSQISNIKMVENKNIAIKKNSSQQNQNTSYKKIEQLNRMDSTKNQTNIKTFSSLVDMQNQSQQFVNILQETQNQKQIQSYETVQKPNVINDNQIISQNDEINQIINQFSKNEKSGIVEILKLLNKLRNQNVQQQHRNCDNNEQFNEQFDIISQSNQNKSIFQILNLGGESLIVGISKRYEEIMRQLEKLLQNINEENNKNNRNKNQQISSKNDINENIQKSEINDNQQYYQHKKETNKSVQNIQVSLNNDQEQNKNIQVNQNQFNIENNFISNQHCQLVNLQSIQQQQKSEPQFYNDIQGQNILMQKNDNQSQVYIQNHNQFTMQQVPKYFNGQEYQNNCQQIIQVQNKNTNNNNNINNNSINQSILQQQKLLQSPAFSYQSPFILGHSSSVTTNNTQNNTQQNSVILVTM